jgi:hypothetical protein
MPLDPRPRREDFTDRECASIFGGVIAPLIRFAGGASVRETLRVLVHVIGGGAAACDSQTPTGADQAAAEFLSAMYGCLSDNAPPGVPLAALRWWADMSDADWDQHVMQTMEIARAADDAMRSASRRSMS